MPIFREITDIKANPDNPRIISDKKFQSLVRSIKEFPEMLEKRPLVCVTDPVDGIIFPLGGNMRLRACTDAGIKTVPVEMVDDWTEDQRKQFIIKDNVSFGDWNWGNLQEEWDLKDLSAWGLDIPDKFLKTIPGEEDNFEFPKDGFDTDIKPGDLIEIGPHRLLCGDSRLHENRKKLFGELVPDMVLTDPPYNIDYQGVKDRRKVKNDMMTDEDFVQFLIETLNVDVDTFYVFCSWQYSNLFRQAMDKLKKPVKSFIIWDKVNPAQHLDKYFKQHEVILYHGKFGGSETIRGDVWQWKREKNTSHPTMKPVGLLAMILNDQPGKKIVYDGFVGSGSTMVTCHQLKRRCLAMEDEPRICQVVINRMKALDPKIKIKRNGK